MSAREIAASFSSTVTIEADEHEKTTINFTDFENARSKFPPLVTGTVYETEKLPDDTENSVPNFDRYDSFNHLEEDGDSDEDEEDIFVRLRSVDNCLKKKVTEILRKNPWLASEITTRPNGKLAMKFKSKLTQADAEKRSLKVVRVVATTTAGSDRLYGSPSKIDTSTTRRQRAAAKAPSAMDLIIADPITKANTYKEIIDAIRPELHTSTEAAVGDHRSLWNVLLIPLRVKSTSAWSNKFLLVHSLDSCLADPATLYKVYRMLTSDREVEKLDPVRCKDLNKIKENLLAGDDPNFMRCAGIKTANAKRRALHSFSNTTSVWTIDEDRIEQIKDQQQMKSCLMEDEVPDQLSMYPEPNVAEISTNDILTSWFLSQNRDASVGCLLADIRGRDPEVHAGKVGNYQVEIVYNTREKCHDARTPAWIRKSIMRDGDEKLKRHEDRPLPGFMTLSKAQGATVVSNWSSLCSTHSLEHSGNFILKPGEHLPLLLDAHHGFFSSVGWNSMVIFRYTENKLGVVITAPAKATGGRRLPLNRPALFEE